MEKLLTVTEAAQILSCSIPTVRRWLSERRLPKVKVGGLTRLRERDLEAFLRLIPARKSLPLSVPVAIPPVLIQEKGDV